jgi:hypothetical protein
LFKAGVLFQAEQREAAQAASMKVTAEAEVAADAQAKAAAAAAMRAFILFVLVAVGRFRRHLLVAL